MSLRSYKTVKFEVSMPTEEGAVEVKWEGVALERSRCSREDTHTRSWTVLGRRERNLPRPIQPQSSGSRCRASPASMEHSALNYSPPRGWSVCLG